MYLQHEKDVYNAAVARMTIDPIKNLMIDGDRKVFFVGAGVSKDWPSCCFTGPELSCLIVESCVTDLPSFEKYARVITRIIKYNQKASRLEVLLDIARQGIGKEVFQIFRIFEKSKPNLNHFFLAGAICEGYIVVTTNFDNLIEEAYKQIAPGKPLNLILYDKDFNRWLNTNRNEPALFKLHGTILDLDYRRKIDTIAATLNSLSSGLSPPPQSYNKFHR